MAYSTTANIAAIYGSTNRDDWADLDGDGSPDSGVIDDWITKADAMIDSVMRRTHYTVPVATAAGATPTDINWISAALAGGIGYMPRGMEDRSNAPLEYVAEAKKMLREIATGRRRIDAI